MKTITTKNWYKKAQIDTLDDMAYDVYTRIRADRGFGDLDLTPQQKLALNKVYDTVRFDRTEDEERLLNLIKQVLTEQLTG